jgi:hypothetical protein
MNEDSFDEITGMFAERVMFGRVGGICRNHYGILFLGRNGMLRVSWLSELCASAKI